MALTADRDTPKKTTKLISVALAANAVVYAGGIAVANATGYGAPGSTALSLTYLGRFNDGADNTGGADGDKSVIVERGESFKWKNSAGDPVTQASLGKVCYIEDDETVSLTDGVGTQSAAGIVVGIDANGVWVE